MSIKSQMPPGKESPPMILKLAKPQIVLESLSARSIVRMMLTIIVLFVGCFALDTHLTYSTFSEGHENSQFIHNCTEIELNHIYAGHVANEAGCMTRGDVNGTTTWFSLYGNLYNVLSVEAFLHVTQPTTESPTNVVVYDVSLLGCAHPGGCGDIETNRGSSADDWHIVYDVKNITSTWNIENQESSSTSSGTDNINGPKYWEVEFFHILQNQEALPRNGFLKSYYLRVNIHNAEESDEFHNEKNFMTVYISEGAEGIEVYFFEFLTIILMLATIITLMYYVEQVRKYTPTQPDSDHKKWLPEQIWVVAYLVILLFFQNPFYIGADLDEPNPHSALTAFVVSYGSQTAFMALWLCMADSMSYDDSSLYALAKFYAPKVLFGIAIFIPACVMLGFQFPSIQEHTEASSMLSLQMWPQSERKTFIIFSFMFLLLYWLWALSWFTRLYFTHRRLSLMPYVSTRYQQLLFRFYLLQMSFLAVYSVLQYAFAAHAIGYADMSGGIRDSVELADDVNTMFKQQTEMFGKIIFLSLVGFLLAFVTLPSGFILTGDDLVNMASVYAISEKEKDELLEIKGEQFSVMQGRSMKRGDYIFCLEQALDLLRVSTESYNETEGDVNEVKESIAECLMPYSFRLIEIVSEPDKMLLAIICRHTITNRVIVAFRGTVSLVNMNLNLDRALVPYELASWGLPQLDRFDGLNDDHDKVDFIPTDGAGDDEEASSRPSLFSVRLSGLWRKSKSNSTVDSGLAGSGGGDGGGGGGGKRDSKRRKSGRLTKSQRLNRKNSSEVLDPDEETEKDIYISSTKSVNTVRGSRSSEIINDETDDPIGSSRPSSARMSTEQLDPEQFFADREREGQKGQGEKAMKLAANAIKETGNIFLLALHNTPGLSALTTPKVHQGFLAGYDSLRERIHRIVRNELRENPSEVSVTGHSLGGALATLCALDLTVHTLPRVRAYFRRKEAMEETNRGIGPMLKCVMYTFGQPRVGDAVFSSVFNNLCPEAFRVVVDGDVIVSLPKNAAGYRHAGTSVIVDSKEIGNIIVDPSFVERFFRTKKVYLGVSVHKLANYKGCLEAVQKAAGETGPAEHPAVQKKRQSRSDRLTSIGSSSKDALQSIIRESIARQSRRRSTSDEILRVTQSPLKHPRMSVVEKNHILDDL